MMKACAVEGIECIPKDGRHGKAHCAGVAVSHYKPVSRSDGRVDSVPSGNSSVSLSSH